MSSLFSDNNFKWQAAMRNRSLVSGLASALLTITAMGVQAATVIDLVHENVPSTIQSDGHKARLMRDGADYVIVDYAAGTIKAVSEREQKAVVVDMNTVPESLRKPMIQIDFRPYGQGPQIAGYATEKYEYFAGGKSCGFIYGSRDALQADGVGAVFKAMNTMVNSQRAILGGYAAFMGACKQADLSLGFHVERIGLPMRQESRGVVTTEVKSVRTGVQLPAEAFTIPAHYAEVTALDEMTSVRQKRNEVRKLPPEQMPPHMQNIMRQMQESGQLTPEMMEQMRRQLPPGR